jgi:hypothetical protein
MQTSQLNVTRSAGDGSDSLPDQRGELGNVLEFLQAIYPGDQLLSFEIAYEITGKSLYLILQLRRAQKVLRAAFEVDG